MGAGNKVMETLKTKIAGLAGKLWNFAVSPTVFVVLCIFWCIDLGAGSILAYQRDPKFWMKMDSVPFNVWMKRMAPAELPHSLWVYIFVVLTLLVALSLVLCTIGWFMSRRRRKRTMAEVLLHLGFFLVFAGFVVGSAYGERVQNIVAGAGQEVDVAELGVKLKLLKVSINRDGEGRDLETVSDLELLDGTGALLKSYPARLNHPLIHGATVVYPMGGEERTDRVNLEIEGAGGMELALGAAAALPGGREIMVKGVLERGQRYNRWSGPGAFVVVREPGGGQTGDYLGEHPMFRERRLGSLNVRWAGSKTGQYALLNVHRDPGVQLVIAGAVLLTIGTLWALFVYLARGDSNP